MPELLLRNGLVIGPRSETVADVRIVDDAIVEVGTGLTAGAGVEEIDASGCWVGPGLVDVHAHLREPGGEHKEDIATGSAAAAAGGYTAVVAMPNTEPALDNGELARYVAERGRAVGLVDVFPSGTLTIGRRGEELSDYAELWDAGVRIFTDDGDTVADAGLLRRAMEQLALLGGVVTQHAIAPELAADGHLHDGEHAASLGLGGIPSEAETEIVARDIELVRLTGASYHLQHVSCAESVELMAAAKAAGLPVTVEATPHHLAFDHADLVSADTHFKMMPPLRLNTDRAALREGLRSGVIDVVATDHAPHAPHEKEVAFDEAAFGVIGLEHAAAVVNTTVGLEPRSFFERMSVTPARIAGIEEHGLWPAPGAPANLVVFDPSVEVTPVESRSRSVNSPYLGRPWRGNVRATLIRGRVTHHADGAPT